MKKDQRLGSLAAVARPITGAIGPQRASGFSAGLQYPVGDVVGFSAIDAAATVLPTLAGERLVLRGLVASDEPLWDAAMERNREALVGWDLGPDETFESELTDREVAAMLDLTYTFGIFEHGDLIGECSLHDVQRNNIQAALYSMSWLDAERRGNRLAQAAFTLILAFAFEQLGLHRVDVLVLPEVAPVHEALTTFGLEPRGVEPAAALVAGEWRDHVRYAVLDTDWREHAAAWRAAWG